MARSTALRGNWQLIILTLLSGWVAVSAPSAIAQRLATKETSRSPVAASRAHKPVVQPRRLPNTHDRYGANPPANVVMAARSDVVRRRTQHAMKLAERGAVYSAEDEFLQTLQLIAHQNDAKNNTHSHSEALGAGLLALKEADALSVALKSPATSRNVKSLVAAHETPVLANVVEDSIPALQALQQYYDFAQLKICQAVAHGAGASEVLYGLARVYMVQAKSGDETAAIAKAIACLQMSLAVNPSNYLAANELGVLLARCGRLEQAKRVLLQGLTASDQAETWHNLSNVHARLGETDLAQRAEQRWRSAVERKGRVSKSDQLAARVRWVDTSTFVDRGARGVGADSAPLQRAAPTPVVKSSTSPKRPSGLDHFKSMFRFKKSTPATMPSSDDRLSQRPQNHPAQANH